MQKNSKYANIKSNCISILYIERAFNLQQSDEILPKYLGSVKFYKHLIITVILIVITLPTIICVLLIGKNLKLSTTVTHQMNLIESLELSSEKTSVAHSAVIEIATADSDQKPIEYTFDPIRVSGAPSFDYQSLYPDMYVKEARTDFAKEPPHTVYLTFDDGPSKYTSAILDLLKQYNIKATFFIIYDSSEQAKTIYNRIIDEGHELGIHSTTHAYNQIYTSTKAYLEDFHTTENLLYTATGVKPKIFRFPGGSINSYNRNTYTEIIAEMLRRGYLFYDWNVNAADAEPKSSVNSIITNVTYGTLKWNKSIVLFHDTKKDTLEALPTIIKELTQRGAVFRKLDNTVKPITFSYTE